MPDHMDDMLLPIVRAADRVAWDDPAAVRGRGQARARHRAIAAGLAVVLAAGLGAGTAWALGRPDGGALPPIDPGPSITGTEAPSPSPSAPETSAPSAAPTSEPAPFEPPRQFTGTPIPLSAMLQPADMPSGYGSSDAQEGDDHGSITMMIYYCGQGTYSTASDHWTAFHKRSLGKDEQHFVLQQTNRYEAGWAARHVRDIQAVLPRCTKVNLGQNPQYPTTLTVIAADFAGDGSVLVKQVGRNADGDFTQYLAVVRQGDVESTMRISVAGLTDAGARDIVRKAATRLCAATPTC